MTTYRDFNIDHNGWAYIYSHKEYDGPEDKRCGSADSIEDAKDSIDEYYYENIIYAVHHSEALAPAKFCLVSEAIDFCKFWGFDLTRITPYLHRWEFSFDSI
jgi:hypothetical protein